MKEAWRTYRDHQAKNAAWIICDLARKGAKTLADLGPIYDANSDHNVVLDVVKQLGLYTDCLGKAHWSEPHVVVDEALVKQIIFIAQILLPKREITEREMELWVEHMSDPILDNGMLEFQKAMIAEGLSDHSLEEVERFLGASNTLSLLQADSLRGAGMVEPGHSTKSLRDRPLTRGHTRTNGG